MPKFSEKAEDEHASETPSLEENPSASLSSLTSDLAPKVQEASTSKVQEVSASSGKRSDSCREKGPKFRTKNGKDNKTVHDVSDSESDSSTCTQPQAKKIEQKTSVSSQMSVDFIVQHVLSWSSP